MKKRILVIHFNMELGGVESSLLGLLDTFDYDKYSIYLFLYAHEGGMMPLINANVNILPEMSKYRALTESIQENFKQGLFAIGMARIMAKVRSGLSTGSLHSGHNYKQYFHKLCIPYLPDIPGDYDLDRKSTRLNSSHWS